MIKDLKVKVGPQFYMYSTGAIQKVETVLDEYACKNILIVHGTISWDKAKPFLNFINNESFNFIYHQYTGECSYYGADLIKTITEEENIDFIIGVGGGKLTDLVGYAASIANVPFGVIPTLPSNCAPWTPLAVMYKESGESEGRSEHFLRQAAFFITDPALVIDSPVEYFVAGLADTIAKWYESDSILNQPHLEDENILGIAKYIATISKDRILKDGKKAIEDMKSKQLSNEFISLSEIIFAIAGMVGGIGDKYARNAAAHAMHDGLGKYMTNFHDYLHGEVVAYGIFYQMAVEDRWDEIDALLPFYRELKLPRSLKDMDMELDEDTADGIVDFIFSKDKVHLIPVDITKEKLKEAIKNLENYIESIEGE